MNKKNANQPASTLRDGSLKATIWKNEGENGPRYSVNLSRTWRDEQGNYHDSDGFSGSEVLRIARLANIAYDEIANMRENDRTPQP